MILRADLRRLARARLQDARVLYRGGRYDGAVYLCGYAVEMALKERMCRTLGWPDFPSTDAEFKNLTNLRTHNFDVLLRLSGTEARIRTRHVLSWSRVASWAPDLRYRPVGSVTAVQARDMIAAVATLLRTI
jgi:HEPN domain-containing protein